MAVLSRTLESALAADRKRLRSLRGSVAPARVKNAATARVFLTLLRPSCPSLSSRVALEQPLGRATELLPSHAFQFALD
jgi:hypothetical protein